MLNEVLHKFIDISVPVKTCNFRCKYCYVTQRRLFDSKKPVFKFTPGQLRRALSAERLGGRCLLNFCAGGETLLFPEVLGYIKALLDEGHFVMIVTNGSCSQQIEKICEWDEDSRSRTFFKFSYHYEQLKNLNLFDRFFSNIDKIRQAGMSFTLEAVPYDSQIQFIDEMKRQSLEKTGAMCHVTVSRDESKPGLKLLTKLSREDFYNTWKTFDSELFEYKFKIFGKKITQPCHGGEKTFWLKLSEDNGILMGCYGHGYKQEIVKNWQQPLIQRPIGKCCFPHCYNGHAWLVLGAIPEMQAPTYAQLRNRVCADGSEWLQPRMKAFLSQRTH